MKLDYIIPVYNEERNIASIIKEIRNFSQDRIIVVDDGSKDRTYIKIPQLENLIKIRNTKNFGKGYSIKRALYYANEDFICLLDGDVSGVISHIDNLKEQFMQYDCMVLTPSIKGGGFGIFRNYASAVVKRKTSVDAPWCISGVRVIKRDVLKKIVDALDDRFACEVSMTVELLNKGYRVENFDVEFSHDITGRDIGGFYHRGRQLADVFKYNLRSGK